MSNDELLKALIVIGAGKGDPKQVAVQALENYMEEKQMMTKKDKLETLMLISALESYCLSKDSLESYPDYLLETTSDVVEKLKADVLGEE
jgi:hypothetical protein